MSTKTLEITLQNREYSIACTPGEREALREVAIFLDARMTDIAKKTKSTGERLAVMTALNLAHELYELLANKQAAAPPAEAPTASTEAFDTPEIARRINSIVARLDAAMVP